MLDKLRQMEENYHAMQEKMMDPEDRKSVV